jgi:hypothetical protein
MTGKTAKIYIAEDKSPVEVGRRTAEMLNFRRISVFEGLSQRHAGYFGDQPPSTGGPDSATIDHVACRNTDYGVKWEIPAILNV